MLSSGKYSPVCCWIGRLFWRNWYGVALEAWCWSHLRCQKDESMGCSVALNGLWGCWNRHGCPSQRRYSCVDEIVVRLYPSSSGLSQCGTDTERSTWSPKSHARLSMHAYPSTQPLHWGKPAAILCDLIQSTTCDLISPSWSDEDPRTMTSPEIVHPVHPHWWFASTNSPNDPWTRPCAVGAGYQV